MEDYETYELVMTDKDKLNLWKNFERYEKLEWREIAYQELTDPCYE